MRDDALERETGEKNQWRRETHRHTDTHAGLGNDERRGNWELGIGNLGFSVSRSHKNTFSGFGSFYSFFVQIKIDSRLVIMQSNLESESSTLDMMMGKERREGKRSSYWPKRCASSPRLSSADHQQQSLCIAFRNSLTCSGGGGAHWRRGKGRFSVLLSQGAILYILRPSRRNIGCGA